MTAQRHPSIPNPSPGQERSGKRPYVRPAFRHERVFEVMALACGKVQQGPTCAGMKKAS
ncbi:MAG TPA: hypothetical protein VGH80_07855 [Xanthomonadaceae bacterium]|jgi:hypothetical protein